MKPRWFAFGIVFALGVQGRAAAQGPAPAPPGQWTAREARVIVSAERAFGIHAYRFTYEPPDGDATEINGAMVSLLYGQSVINGKDDQTNPYAVPRIAVDGVLHRTFTLGGSLGFGVSAGARETGSSSPDLPLVFAFALHGRLGYLLVQSGTLAYWLRAGAEYFWGSYDDSEAQVENVTKAVALTIDPQLVITPAPHAAILVGPLINIGIWGSYERRFPSRTDQVDFTLSNLGVTVGLALFF